MLLLLRRRRLKGGKTVVAAVNPKATVWRYQLQSYFTVAVLHTGQEGETFQMNGSEKTLSYGQGMQSCGRVTSTSFYRRIRKNLQRGHIRPPPSPPPPTLLKNWYTLFAQSDYSVPKTVHFLIKKKNAKNVHHPLATEPRWIVPRSLFTRLKA